VIFTLGVGEAELLKKQLIAQSARATIATEGSDSHETSKLSETTEQDQKKASQARPTGIEVEMIQSDEIKLPAEFQVAIYENLIRQLQKKGGFENVYRDGDRNATEHPETIVLHCTVKGFKQGSERARQVTTVAGATSMTVQCRFTDANGHTLLERDIKGKVRFFGGNLKATYDFAKKAAGIAREVSVEQSPRTASL
jgi:hypothetical protein